MYRHNAMMLMNLLLLTAAMFMAAGCNQGVFNDANYQPVPSQTGINQENCYGRMRQIPECVRPLKAEKEFKANPEVVYIAPALQRMSWYIAEAPGNTSSSWVMGDYIYDLALNEKIVIPAEGSTACRKATFNVKVYKSALPWRKMAESFCYNPDYRLWLPKGFTPAKL